MYEDLLEILREPATGAQLRLDAARWEGKRIDEGLLRSDETGRQYPIVRGIPRFADAANYTASFGAQWNAFRSTQLDSATGARASAARMAAETGWTPEQLEGKRVLDGGCGAGRFAEVTAKTGARLVGLDYSSAIDAAAATLARFESVQLVQGSLLEPPFAKGSFDFAYCIGVAQHTPDPELVVANVVDAVTPGGEFALTIYARRPWTKLNTKYLVRPITKRMPHATLKKGIERSMPVVFPVTDFLFRIPVLGRVARFTIPVANYVERDDLTREQRYEEAVLDTLDMLSPAFDSPMTWQEVERVLRRVDAQAWRFNTRVPINVVGVR